MTTYMLHWEISLARKAAAYNKRLPRLTQGVSVLERSQLASQLRHSRLHLITHVNAKHLANRFLNFRQFNGSLRTWQLRSNWRAQCCIKRHGSRIKVGPSTKRRP